MGNDGKQSGVLTVRKNTELQKILDFSYINYTTFSPISAVKFTIEKHLFFSLCSARIMRQAQFLQRKQGSTA